MITQRSILDKAKEKMVPLARGGKSTKGNIVPACVECNRKKKLETPAETALRKLSED